MNSILSCRKFLSVLVCTALLGLAAGPAYCPTKTATHQFSAGADDGFALTANKEIQDANATFLISLPQAAEAYSTFFTEGSTYPACDGWAWAQGQQTLDSNSLYIGTNNRDYFVPYAMSAMRFETLAIFRGMEVISANFRIYSSDEMNDKRVFGIIHGGLPGWPYVFEDISQIEKTQASVVWDHIDAWQPNTWYYSPDLTNIVQELINKPDWKIGHPMTMVYSTTRKSSSLRSFLSSEMGYDFAPKLKIRFRACVIFGYVRTAEGDPIQGAIIDGGDDLEKRTSFPDGVYQFFVPPGWSGTLTVSKDDIVFKPPQYTYTNLNTHMYEQNFTEYKPRISGFILDKYGEGLEQANISADNGGASGVSDANGFYEIIVPLNWSGTVTVNKPGWKITPQQVSYSNLVTDQNDQNYSAYQPTISGWARDEQGLALEAAQIDIEGVGAVLTDPNGQYQIDVPYMWSGKITASMTDWGFLPRYRSYYHLTTDRTNQDFTSFQPIISGYVRKSDGSAIAQATLQASNGGPSALTNADGYYELTLPYYWSGVITISKDQMPFTPQERTYSNIIGNWSNQNYTVIDPKISGYVRTDDGSAVASVTVQASNGGGSVLTDSAGYYELTVLYNWSGVVTPNRVGCTFDPADRSYTDVTADLPNQDYLTALGIIYVKQDGSGDFTTTQAAIDAAIDGHIIIVATGTYTGNGNRDIDFKAKAITVRGETGDPNDCIIDCQGTETDPHRGFKFISGEDANSVLEAVTITNGYGPKEDIYESGFFYSCGGAIYCDNSSPQIKNCIIHGNYAKINGGGICTRNSNPSIKNCNIANNLAGNGGGIYNLENSNPDIIECKITNNSATNQGGGICNSYYCKPRSIRCIISNNSATFCGGGMFNAYSSDPKTTSCIFKSNSAGDRGGGMYNNYSSPNIINCNIINNNAGHSCGGIYIQNSSSSFMNNCIIWGNSLPQIYGTAIVTYSDIQGGSTGVGNIDADPLFAADGYHLTSISPCMDAGDPNYVAGPNETDIDGDPRVVFGQIDMGADEVYSDDSSLIILSKSEINFIAMGLYSAPQTDSFVINNYGIKDLDWSIQGADECGWLDIEPANGLLQFEESVNASLSINPDKANYGINSCQLLVSDANAENSPQVVTVNVEVLPPELAVSPSQFYFETFIAEPNTAGQILFIQNSGYDTLYWDINVPDEHDGLNFSVYTGQADSNQISEVILNIDHNNIKAGHYQFDITISDPNAANSPQVIPVEVHVLSHKGQRHVPSEYDTIQAAIDAAVDGDEVIIHPGTYTGQGNFNIDFKGKVLTVRCINPHNPAVVAATIIDADNNPAAAGFDFHTGEDPNSVVDGLTITRCGWGAVGCYQSSPTIRNCIIKNNCNAPEGGGAAIACGDSSAIIKNCIIKDNKGAEEGGSGILLWRANVTIANCLITDNWSWAGGGISCYNSDALIRNCTFTNRSHTGFGEGIFVSYSSYLTINNSIFWGNDPNNGHKITIEDYSGLFPSTVTVTYSNVQGGQNAVYGDPTCTLIWGAGNIDSNPHFAEDDFHLQSQPGRLSHHVYIDIDLFGDGIINLLDFCVLADSWQQQGLNLPADFDNSGIVDLSDLVHLLHNYLTTYTPIAWAFDDVNTSPCIDAGDPNSDWTPELWPHGRRINMGAYGGTPQASMSLSNIGNAADFNLDDIVGWRDLIILLNMWLAEDPILAQDIDRNGFVNFTDYAKFTQNWLWQQ